VKSANSVYQNSLPHSFPFVALVDAGEAAEIALRLVTAEGPCESGSSFAITSDVYPIDPEVSLRWLWLSRASRDRLLTLPRWFHLDIHPAYKESE